MLNDVAAIEINVFHQRPAIGAVEDYVFSLSWRPTTLDYHTERIRRPHWSVRNIRRDEEGLAFAYQVIDDPIAVTDAYFDVALQLVEVLFRIDQVKIVPGVRTLDNHDEKVAPVIEITVAHRRLELLSVFFDPVF